MIRRIVPLTEAQESEDGVRDKINEIIFAFNELVSTLKPSAQERGENKGTENEILEDYKIKEPDNAD